MTDSFSTPTSFRSIFEAAADENRTMTFDRFMELALYHPQVGYYQSDQKRIGYEKGSDFFTAATSGPLFGELVAAACTTLLGSRPASDFAFVEIGSETERGVLDGVAHPFKTVRTWRLGETLALSGRCVVFSNELFDAQPFRRFVRRAGRWRELGVTLRDDSFAEVELTTPTPEWLPHDAPEGYVIDAPTAAAALAERLIIC